jgi:hypothetical protein
MDGGKWRDCLALTSLSMYQARADGLDSDWLTKYLDGIVVVLSLPQLTVLYFVHPNDGRIIR